MNFIEMMERSIEQTQQYYNKVSSLNEKLRHYDTILAILEEIEGGELKPLGQEGQVKSFNFKHLSKKEREDLILELREVASNQEAEILMIMHLYNLETQNEDVLLEMKEEFETARELYKIKLNELNGLEEQREKYRDLTNAVVVRKEQNPLNPEEFTLNGELEPMKEILEKRVYSFYSEKIDNLKKELGKIVAKYDYCQSL